MKAIILAAGNGSRLAPIGLTRPKVLVPVANKPLLTHHIETVSPHVDEVVVVIGPNEFGRQTSSYIQSQTWPISVSTVIQEKPLGTANAYQAAAEQITGYHRLLCLNGDDLYSPIDINNLVKNDFAVLGQPVSDPEKWGILLPDAHGFLQQIVEKPSQPIGNLANTGAYLISSQMLDLYGEVSASARGEFEITDSINLFKQNHRVAVVEVQNYWLPIGYPWHILEAHQKLIDQPIMGKNVQLGQNVSITGQTVIGDNVRIGDNTTINESTILPDVEIGPNCIIESSIIGQEAVLLSGVKTEFSSIKNSTITTYIKDQLVDTNRHRLGAVIGDRAAIGENVIIHAGIKIWPGIEISANQIISTDVMS